MSLEAVNPNQFAFPGMESQSHPLARHVAAGLNFQMRHKVPAVATDRPQRRYYDPPGAFDPAVSEHHLVAKRGEHQLMGDLQWAGSAQRRTPDNAGHFPGEITWVGRHPASGREAPPGLMTDMYKAGHQIGMGQETVPVHSPDRTPGGEEWSRTVGPSKLRPKLGDFDWRPPEGTHPYERAGSPRQLAPAMEGQGELPGVLGHVLSAQRKVDRHGRPNRAVASATFHNGVRVR